MSDLPTRERVQIWLDEPGLTQYGHGAVGDLMKAYAEGRLVDLLDGDLYMLCPDCGGTGSYAEIDPRYGEATERQCERCHFSRGYVKVERGEP